MVFRACRRCQLTTCHNRACAIDRLLCSCISEYFQKDVVRPREVQKRRKNKRLACPTGHTPHVDNKGLFCELSNRDLNPEQLVVEAAHWYAANREYHAGAFVPVLRNRFGLTALQAIQAAQLARTMVDRHHG